MEKPKEIIVFGKKVSVEPPHKENCDCTLCQEIEEYEAK